MTIDLPETMKLIVISAPGGPEALTLGKAPVPRPGDGEVLIQIAAAGVNRADVFQRQGKYPPPPGASEVLGMEAAGTVAAVGARAGNWKVGDPICALLSGGGYAEYCLAPAPQCLPMPTGLSFIEAAATPEAAFTVWANVFQRGHLAAGETFLVHGGSSGIGTLAIQLAKAFGATVLTTAGSDAKCAACLKLGADTAINYKREDFAARVAELTNQRGVDLILDMVGGDYFEKNAQALAVEGRLVLISTQAGGRVLFDFRVMMAKRLTLTGSTLRSRSVDQKGAIAQEVQANVWPLLESSRVKPIIDSTFPLADAAEAHRHMESSAHIGKIVLTI